MVNYEEALLHAPGGGRRKTFSAVFSAATPGGRGASLLIAAMGEPLTFWERRTFAKFTQRTASASPARSSSGLVAVAGRRGGQEPRIVRAGALPVGVVVALFRRQSRRRASKVPIPREKPGTGKDLFLLLRWCLQILCRYREMVINKTPGHDLAEQRSGSGGESCVSVELSRVLVASAVLADEAAHWATDSASANADTEILNARETVPGNHRRPVVDPQPPLRSEG